MACKLPVNIVLALTKPTDRGVGQDGRTKCARRAATFPLSVSWGRGRALYMYGGRDLEQQQGC